MATDTFFPYMPPRELARLHPDRRIIQDRVEARWRHIEDTTPRWELDRREEMDRQAAAAARTKRSAALLTPAERFRMQWKVLSTQASEEDWTVDYSMKVFARAVARILGQDDVRACGRVLDVFKAHGGRATRKAVLSLLREGVRAPRAFQWLEARADNYARDVDPGPRQGRLV